jgi:hypothetical protein
LALVEYVLPTLVKNDDKTLTAPPDVENVSCTPTAIFSQQSFLINVEQVQPNAVYAVPSLF